MKVARENALRARAQKFEELGYAFDQAADNAPNQGGTVYASGKAREAYSAARDIREQLEGE